MKRLGLISLMIVLVIALVGGLVLTSCTVPAEEEEEEEEETEAITRINNHAEFLITELGLDPVDALGIGIDLEVLMLSPEDTDFVLDLLQTGDFEQASVEALQRAQGVNFAISAGEFPEGEDFYPENFGIILDSWRSLGVSVIDEEISEVAAFELMGMERDPIIATWDALTIGPDDLIQLYYPFGPLLGLGHVSTNVSSGTDLCKWYEDNLKGPFGEYQACLCYGCFDCGGEYKESPIKWCYYSWYRADIAACWLLTTVACLAKIPLPVLPE